MNKKKTVGIPVAILTIIAGIAGGSYAIDFSTTSTVITDNSQTSGDTETNIFVDIKEDVALVAICLMNPIPEEYTEACENR